MSATKTMIFPREVRLTLDNRAVTTFPAGAQEVPAELVNHPYLKAHGVVPYTPAVARAQAAVDKANAAHAKAVETALGAAEKLADSAGLPAALLAAGADPADQQLAAAASAAESTANATTDATGGKTAGDGRGLPPNQAVEEDAAAAPAKGKATAAPAKGKR